MSDFFNFDSRFRSSAIQAHSIGLNENQNGNGDSLNLVKGVYEGIYFPVTFKQEYGKKLCDILDTGSTSLYLISERMRQILEDNQLTGWKVFPIKLYDKKNNEILGYHGFSVVGHCGPVFYKKSTIFEKQYIPDGPICRVYKGRFIDDWDGSDFFTPNGTYHLFVFKKAADILKKNKISNLDLTNLLDSEVDVDN